MQTLVKNDAGWAERLFKEFEYGAYVPASSLDGEGFDYDGLIKDIAVFIEAELDARERATEERCKKVIHENSYQKGYEEGIRYANSGRRMYQDGFKAGIAKAIEVAEGMLKKNESTEEYRAFNTALHLLLTTLEKL